MSLKSRILETCRHVASQFPGWTFTAGQFKNKELNFVTRCVSPSFVFHSLDGSSHPAVAVEHKPTMSLFESIFDCKRPTSLIKFWTVKDYLAIFPADRSASISFGTNGIDRTISSVRDLKHGGYYLDVENNQDIEDFFRDMLLEGMSLLDIFYSFKTENDLLLSLPPKYEAPHLSLSYDEYEHQKGLMMCAIKIFLGDFDFAKQYLNDEFKTQVTKNHIQLEKLRRVLPDLEARYKSTGSL